ncbi:MAG: LacI family DNA-binding transcriptional regulator [Rhizobiaceae bacterium]
MRTGQRVRQKAKEVRLRDVADYAGVSLMTVSNVMNRRFESMTSETKRRVEQAIEALGYRPNAAGRSLRVQQQASIGLIIVDESPTFLADPFITQVVAGLSNIINVEGFAISLQGLAADQLADATLLRSVRTDAICIKLSGPKALRSELVQLVADSRQPIVLFQETHGEDIADLCSVRQDDYGGGYCLGAHARRQDSRRAVILQSHTDWPAFEERKRGIEDGLAGHSSIAVLRYSGDPFRGTLSELGKYMTQNPRPDVVFGLNDQAAVAAARFFQSRGDRIPDDVIITGFNAFGFWDQVFPQIPTVRSSAYEVGVRGGKELLARLASGRFAKSDIVLPVVPIINADHAYGDGSALRL